MSNTSLTLVTYGVVIIARLAFAKIHDRAAPLMLGAIPFRAAAGSDRSDDA